MERIRNSLYFYLSVRCIAILCCVIVLFCVALSDGWASRIPAILGLVFTLLALLFISCSVATLFAWDLVKMGLPKRCLFVWVFLICSLVAAVMFIIAPAVCDKFNQYGCFETTYSTGFKVAAAFSIVNMVLGIFDVALNFVFHFRSAPDVSQETQCPSRQNSLPRPPGRPLPTISIIDTTIHDDTFYEPYRKGQSTYV